MEVISAERQAVDRPSSDLVHPIRRRQHKYQRSCFSCTFHWIWRRGRNLIASVDRKDCKTYFQRLLSDSQRSRLPQKWLITTRWHLGIKDDDKSESRSELDKMMNSMSDNDPFTASERSGWGDTGIKRVPQQSRGGYSLDAVMLEHDTEGGYMHGRCLHWMINRQWKNALIRWARRSVLAIVNKIWDVAFSEEPWDRRGWRRIWPWRGRRNQQNSCLQEREDVGSARSKNETFCKVGWRPRIMSRRLS